MLVIILKGICSVHRNSNLIFQSVLLRFIIITIDKATDFIRRRCILQHARSIAIGLRDIFCIDRQLRFVNSDVTTAGNNVIAGRICPQLIHQFIMTDFSSCCKPFARIGPRISCSTIALTRIIFTIRLDFIGNIT